jgi:hypothetical protein
MIMLNLFDFSILNGESLDTDTITSVTKSELMINCDVKESLEQFIYDLM